MISIKVATPPANFPFSNAVRQMWSVIYFSAAGPSRTNVREVTLGFGMTQSRSGCVVFSRTPEGRAIHGEVRAGDATIWLHRATAEHHLDSPLAVDVANSGLHLALVRSLVSLETGAAHRSDTEEVP